jgi:hypothetical protein
MMEEIVDSLPDRPVTHKEVEEIRGHDRVIGVETVFGVVVTDEGDGYSIDAFLDPLNQTDFDYHMDLIIETEPSIGVAAYPKEKFPPPEEIGDTPIIEIISTPGGEWTWISKGQKPGYDIADGLWQLEEYRDLGSDGREAFETMIELPTLKVLMRNESGLIRPFINVFRFWLRDKVRR